MEQPVMWRKGSLLYKLFSRKATNVYLLAICCFSFFDAIFTLFWLQEGVAAEANPIMRWVFETWGPSWFLSIKVLVTWAGCSVLAVFSKNLFVRRVTMLLALFYCVLIAGHLFFMSAISPA